MARQSLICFLFFLSGSTSLVLELVWSRMLMRIFGATIYANATVIGAFMAGSAIGSFLAGRYFFGTNSRATKNIFIYYGCLELIIALSSIAFLFIFKSDFLPAVWQGFNGLVSGNDVLTYLARFILMTIVLLVPCTAMGATYPLLGNLISRLGTKGNAIFPQLYTANCAGAAAGCLASGFILLPNFGLENTIYVAAGIGILVFCLTLATNSWLASALRLEPTNIHAEPNQANLTANTTNQKETFSLFASAIFVSFCAGSGATILELSWMRLFSLLFGSSTYSFSVVLSTVLTAMAIGAFLSGRLIKARQVTLSAMAVALLLAAIFLLPNILWSKQAVSLFAETSINIGALPTINDFVQAIITRAFLAALYILPAAAMAGALLPLSQNLIKSDGSPGSSSRSIAQVYTANCIGAITGSAIGGFILIPLLMEWFPSGIEAAFKLVASTYLFLAAGLFFLIWIKIKTNKIKSHTQLVFGAVCCLLCFGIWLVPSTWSAKTMSLGPFDYSANALKQLSGSDLPVDRFFYKEGVNSTTSITESVDLNTASLRTDGKVEATLPLDPLLPAIGSDQFTHILLAELPMLLHRGPAQQVMLIGFGSGITAKAFLEHPDLSLLRIAELEPSVIELNHHLPNMDSLWLNKPSQTGQHVDLRLNDARYLLHSQTDKFDVIASQPADPWVSGSADLYTKEFWALGKRRLSQHGIFCQWLQLYAMPKETLATLIDTFQAVFPQTFICHIAGAGEIILVGFKDKEKLSWAEINSKVAAVLAQSATKASMLEQSGIFGSADLLVLIKQVSSTSSVPSSKASNNMSSDDNLLVEFAASKAMLLHKGTLNGNLDLILNKQDVCLENLIEDVIETKNKARLLARLARAEAARLTNNPQEYASNSKRALFLANRGVKDNPCPETFWLRSLVEDATQKPEEAGADRREALKYPADCLEDYISRIDICLSENNLVGAEKAMKNAISKYPSASSLQDRSAWLALALRQPKLAIKHFDQSAKAAHPALLSHWGRAYAEHYLCNNKAARQALEHYLTINPWNYDAQLFYSLLLAKDNQWQKARTHALSCSRLHEKNLNAFYFLLHSELEAKQFDQAEETAALICASNNSNINSLICHAQNSKKLPALATNQEFISLVSQIRSHAEDAKCGYKMFGLP